MKTKTNGSRKKITIPINRKIRRIKTIKVQKCIKKKKERRKMQRAMKTTPIN